MAAPFRPSPVGRAGRFVTLSGHPVDATYGPDRAVDLDYGRDLGDPGVFPFTRGLHASGYGGKLWTMRQFAGFGTPAETNRRFRHLLRDGGSGLSVAFDLPTLMGRDPDHPQSCGEVGRCGVSVASLADMEALFDGIPLDRVTTSMTINSPAAVIFAMYFVVAERRQIGWQQLSGTIQNDILKEFIAQKEFIFPPVPSMRLVTDLLRFCTEQAPKWNALSVSGYHIREAGAAALQELAFTIRNAIEYVEWGIRSGLEVDRLAPHVSFFFNAQSDVFEEIAKYRAARRVWARVMRDRFGARDDRSCRLRFHTQTAGVSLTARQPYNNVVRTALQALSAVLGGTNSLHTNALDEALGLPTATSATLALRTQQVLAHETGLADHVDPFGGSWLLEQLTNDLEAGVIDYIDRIDRMGGMLAAIERGLPQREIAEAAYRFHQAVEGGERQVVGVNVHVDEGGEPEVPTFAVDAGVAAAQTAAIDAVRARRNQARVAQALGRLREDASGTANLMPALFECVREYASIGEICDVLRGVWGEYEEIPSI